MPRGKPNYKARLKDRLPTRHDVPSLSNLMARVDEGRTSHWARRCIEPGCGGRYDERFLWMVLQKRCLPHAVKPPGLDYQYKWVRIRRNVWPCRGHPNGPVCAKRVKRPWGQCPRCQRLNCHAGLLKMNEVNRTRGRL